MENSLGEMKMDYEKFNDAMCRLRQAEEDLHKALQDVYSIINEADRKPSHEETVEYLKANMY